MNSPLIPSNINGSVPLARGENRARGVELHPTDILTAVVKKKPTFFNSFELILKSALFTGKFDFKFDF